MNSCPTYLSCPICLRRPSRVNLLDGLEKKDIEVFSIEGYTKEEVLQCILDLCNGNRDALHECLEWLVVRMVELDLLKAI